MVSPDGLYVGGNFFCYPISSAFNRESWPAKRAIGEPSRGEATVRAALKSRKI